MSYEKTTWQNGDVITAEKLNKIEDGIGVFIVNVRLDAQYNLISKDKTYNEIANQLKTGNICYAFCIVDYTETTHAAFLVPLTRVYTDDESVFGNYIDGGMQTTHKNAIATFRDTFSIKFVETDEAVSVTFKNETL